MLNSLVLTNWRTHKQTKLEFGDGTNLIIGVMGSGKSSIVNAISFALFGTFPQLKSRSVSLEEIIMDKPNPENQAKVELTLTNNKQKYRVERVINRGSSSEAKLYEETTGLIAGPKQKDVNERIEKILGISYELFSRAVYAEQNEIDFFLKLSPSERKKKFDELLEIDKYELVKKNAGTIENDFVKEKKGLEELIKQQNENIKNQGEEKINKELLEEEKNIELLIIDETKLKKLRVELNKEYLIEGEKEKEHMLLQNENLVLVERVKTLKEFIKKNELLDETKIGVEETKLRGEEQKSVIKLKKIEEEIRIQLNKEKENKKLREELIKMEHKLELLEKEGETKTSVEEIKQKLEETLKQITNLSESKKELEKEKELIQINLKKIWEETNLIKHELNKINKERIEIEKIDGKCPKCKREMSEEHKTKMREEFSGEEKELNKKLGGLEKRRIEWEEKELTNKNNVRFNEEDYLKKEREKIVLENEEKKITLIEEKEKEKKLLLEQIPKTRIKLEEINLDEKKLEENKNKKNNLEKDIIGLRNELKRIFQEKELVLEKKEKQQKLVEGEQKLRSNEELLKKIGFDKNKFSRLQEEFYSIKNNYNLVVEKLNSKNEIKKNLESTLKKINEMKESVKELENKTQKTTKIIEKVGVFSNCLIATQIELRREMLDTINRAMNSVWEEIYPYKDYTSAKLSVVQNGYDLEVLTRNGEWVRVEGILSGGERSAAAICIRIAFALVLTKNLSILILDEPTHNLDLNAVTKLSEMLKHKLPKLVEQIFVITHEKNFENAATSNIYLLERDKDSDEATKVNCVQLN